MPVCGSAAESGGKVGASLPLAEYSLEQLMNVEITSVAKKPQRLEEAAAAVTVITQEDIRQSGMTSIPELLRMVPGLQVGQIDGSTWAIGSRGFNGKWSNKLLVLLDGRTLYTPTFSGVYWDAQDVMLEDIERIEVIRGPGGTLWGANAVNGVINITTKAAAATQGGLVSAAVSGRERQGAVRYGGEIGDGGHFRIYAKSLDADRWSRPASQANDQRDIRSAGFRADFDLAGGDTVTAQGSAYEGDSSHTDRDVLLAPFPSVVPLDFTSALKGSNLLLRWKRVQSATSEWSLQFYHDSYERRDVQSGEKRDTYDLDFQHRFRLAQRHDIVWGLGYRQTSDNTDARFLASFVPASRRDAIVSAFVQDEIALDGERVRLTVGSKFEHNDYSGTEIQPNLRLSWKIDDRQTAWAAVSRAVHTPSRAEANIQINVAAFPGFPPSLLRFVGNPAVQSEKLTAYEAGYRSRPTDRLFVDVAAFYNEYRNLITLEPGTPFFEASPLPAHLVLPQVMQNMASATSHGLELTGSWQAAEKWWLKAGYSYLKMRVRRDSGSGDTLIESKPGDSPLHQLYLNSRHALNAKTDLSASLYYVDNLAGQNLSANTRLDLRLAYRPSPGVELSLTGRNLLDPGHTEYVTTEGPQTTEVPRSIFGALTWRF
jgi:iron complex outermembrane receptor protein